MNGLEARQRAIERLKREEFDLLVIGGGIVGTGVARDAAMRGLKVALVEQRDFAFGTSGRSSRLLHGGLRYLAQGRIGLVREASVEKRIIHEIAPHLAQPLPFIFPTYANNKKWKLWQLKIGVKIYDLLCGGKNFGASSWLTAGEAKEHAPGLIDDRLQGAVRYFDGFTNDARLVLDTARSAERAGAVVLNYCRYEYGPWLHDDIANEQIAFKTRATVNATGPWAEGFENSQVSLRLTKGIHLVVDRSRLPIRETVVMTEGSRILFAIPWGERAILGTTDTDYDGEPNSVHADRKDVDYVLKIATRFFPAAKLSTGDIVSTWAGLRPLIASARKTEAGKPSDISRSHQIRRAGFEPWWDVAGGKLTTYRLMAEQTVDQVMKHLGKSAPCRTADETLLPENETRGVSGIFPPEFSREAVEHYCEKEWAIRLEDIMLRRTGWRFYFKDSDERATTAVDWMGDFFGWTKIRRGEELERYFAEMDAGWAIH